MRKLVAGFAASLDGYIAGPNGEYDWILIDKEIDFAEQMKRYDAFFYGRRTFEMVAARDNKPTPGITNYVFSNTLQMAPENFVLVQGNVAEQVRAIKQQSGKDIALFGGAGLLTSLLDLRLVDEMTIAFIPVLLGSGKPMVGVLKERVGLQLVKSKQYKNGTVELTYAVGLTDGAE